MIRTEKYPQIQLDVLTRTVRYELSLPSVPVANVEVDAVWAEAARKIAVELRVRMLRRLACTSQHSTITVPTTWWQHFKHVWFPRWALRRWPVRTYEIIQRTDVYVGCPHLELDPCSHHAYLVMGKSDSRGIREAQDDPDRED